MKEKLMSCPFCGCGDISTIKKDTFDGYVNWFSVCCDCDGSGPEKDTRQEAIAAWNNRSEWIPVGERLPEFTAQAGGHPITTVLCVHNGLVCEALYDEHGFGILGIKSKDLNQGNFTHWRPLPAPPLPKED